MTKVDPTAERADANGTPQNRTQERAATARTAKRPVTRNEAKRAAAASPDKRPANRRAEMPFFVPVLMLVICIVISIADLAFLNDVVGQVLDLEQRSSIIISGVLGLVGLSFMVHLGWREANQDSAPLGTVGKVVHYLIWLALGVAISLARLFSAKILDLGAEDGTVDLFGAVVRQQDLVFAPIMLLMYIIAGLGALDAVKSLLLNASFHRALGERSENQRKLKELKRQAAEQQRTEVARLQQEKAAKAREAQAEQAEKKRKKDAEAEQLAAMKLQNAQAIQEQKLETAKKKEQLEQEQLELARKNASTEQASAQAQKERAERRREYHNQLQSYLRLKSGFEDKSRQISEKIALMEKQDAEIDGVDSAYGNAVRIIDEAELSMQHVAALKIHAKTQESVAHLKSVIENFNGSRARA